MMYLTKKYFDIEGQWIRGVNFSPTRDIPFFEVKCSFAVNSLALLKELLVAVRPLVELSHDATNQAHNILPKWFLAKSPPPLSSYQMEEWLKLWREAGDQERVIIEQAQDWSAEDWLYWMVQDNRTIFIAGSSATDGTIDIISTENINLNGAFRWMFKMCNIVVL